MTIGDYLCSLDSFPPASYISKQPSPCVVFRTERAVIVVATIDSAVVGRGVAFQALGCRLVFVFSSFVGRLLFLVLVVDGLDLLTCQLHLVLELLHLAVHLVDE